MSFTGGIILTQDSFFFLIDGLLGLKACWLTTAIACSWAGSGGQDLNLVFLVPLLISSDALLFC